MTITVTYKPEVIELHGLLLEMIQELDPNDPTYQDQVLEILADGDSLDPEVGRIEVTK